MFKLRELNLHEGDEVFDWLEEERALVGIYVDHGYTVEKLQWVLDAREGFDAHVGEAFHLMVPHKAAHGKPGNFAKNEDFLRRGYGIELARRFIAELNIAHQDLPCIVFRASDEDYYFCKLGSRTKDQFIEIIGRLGDLAVECYNEGSEDSAKFRDYVNMQTVNFLRREKMLSALTTTIPALSGLLGAAVDVQELV